VTPPRVVRTRTELAAARAALTGRVAVVMTMGALHDGHVRLIRVAHQRADNVIVTIFVNPLQFAPGEDLERYPRALDADLAMCAEQHVDLVFVPDVDGMYPPGSPRVAVSAGDLGRRLEGVARPGHFDGVLTAVATLLELTAPDVAVFGEKDAQQLELVRRMVADRGCPVEVVGVDTVRGPDGLAASSRNRYLDPGERVVALALSRALAAGAARAGGGADEVLAGARAVLTAEPALEVDYLVVIDETSWRDADEHSREARVLVAGRVGSTRLIDNVRVVLGTKRTVTTEPAEGADRSASDH
jgi:pantoate--beta-alanine ligase